MSTTPPVSAYIPCFNNAKTLAQAIGGLQGQSISLAELFIVDDGSTDDSGKIARDLGVRVIEMESNQGRGAVRARAMEAAAHDLVLCCDATQWMRPDFLAHALPYFSDSRVGAVHGRMIDPQVKGVVGRWRARHLFRQEEEFPVVHGNTLTTAGAILRKSATLQVGNYDRRLRHSEDYDLGLKLAAAGYDIVFDPAAAIETLKENTLAEVMERYVRWNHGDAEKIVENFLEAQVVSLKILLPRDLQRRDFAAAFLTCLVPYFQVVHSYRLRRAASQGSRR